MQFDKNRQAARETSFENVDDGCVQWIESDQYRLFNHNWPSAQVTTRIMNRFCSII